MAAQSKKKWIMRDGRGHIFGPFEITKIKDLLRRGLLTGEEQAAQYPAGDWAPMSTFGELYDLVLETLTETNEQAVVAKASRQMREVGDEPGMQEPLKSPLPKTAADTQNTQRLTNSQSVQGAADTRSGKIKNAPPLVSSSPLLGSAPSGEKNAKDSERKRKPPLIIELTDKSRLFKELKGRSDIIPIVLVIIAALLFYVGAHYKRRDSRNQAFNLLSPHPKKNGDASRAEGFLRDGWSAFYKDTYSGYTKAEESFVEAIEEQPTNTDAILMLLMSDLELWPLSKQDSSDQNTLNRLLQMLSQTDRGGNKRAMGAAATDMMLGREDSASSQVDSSLLTQATEGRLYALKGQLYFNASDCQQALGYFDKAASLMPYWVKPVYMQGLCYSKLGNGAQAQQFLLQALKMNPSHNAARLELGVVEARYFNHEDRGKEYLTVALESGERLLPFVESRGRFELALILDHTGDRAGAKLEAQTAFKLNPGDPDIKDFLVRIGEKNLDVDAASDRQHMAVGDQYMRTGNFLGAQAQYKAAFVENPHNARAAMKAAEALWKLHQTTEAIQYLQKSVAADPKFTESYVLLADYKSQRFDFDGAAHDLESAIKVNPKSYEVYRGYGELFFRRGDMKSSEAYVTRGLQLYEIDVKLNELMSKIKLAQKDLVKATQYAKRAIELDRADVEAQVNYAKVMAAYEGVKDASEYLRDLISTYPSQLPFRVGLADILMSDEQYSSAKPILAQVVAADDRNKEAYMMLGDAEYFSGDLSEALNHYLSAARIDPSDPSALFRSGEVYLKAGKPADALKQFELVMRVNPMFPRAHFNIAKAQLALGVTEEAIKELDFEKKVNPKIADSYELQGDIYLSTRKFSEAVTEYQKASEFRVNSGEIYVKLAKAYRGLHSYDAANAMLNLAKAKESGYGELYKEQGYLFEARGQPSLAADAFEKYLQLEPNSPDKQLILDKINELK